MDCRKCKYSGIVGMKNVTCDYILRTGHRRGCPADQCDKYEPRRKRNAKQRKTAEKARGKDRPGVHDLDGNRTKGNKEKDMENPKNPDPGCLRKLCIDRDAGRRAGMYPMVGAEKDDGGAG